MPDVFGSAKFLDQEEEKLTSLFGEIQLIGEIPIRREDYLQVKLRLRQILGIIGLTKTTKNLQKRWPHVFLMYLSFTAAYNTDLGFWDCIVDDLNLSNKSALYTQDNHWGKLFLKLCETFGLDTFPERESGYKYVTPIRLQGGIPRYSLPDFFEYVVMPSVELRDYSSLDNETALKEIQEQGVFQYRVDNVVKLYLKYGGEIAKEFFVKTRNMARIAMKGDVISPPSKLGLRPYVVQLFEEFIESRDEKDSKRRLRTPLVTFWAHQALFNVLLPEQPIPEKYAYRPHEWKIRLYIDGEMVKEEKYPVKKGRKGHEIFSSNKEIEIGQPYEQAILEFRSIKDEHDSFKKSHNYRLIKRWPIRLLPNREQPPLISFNSSGNIIRHTEGLPAQICRLLIPKDFSISVTGTGNRLGGFSSYWSPWDKWKSELWDLTGAQVLHLLDVDKEEIAVFPILQPLPTPKLIEGKRLEYGREVNEKPLYIGLPPKIFIPFFKEKEQEIAASKIEEWGLKVESRWACQPSIKKDFSFSGLSSSLERRENGFVLPLQELLGSKPIGTFEVEVVNPKEEKFSLPFRIWPALEVEGLKSIFVSEGAKEIVELLISIPKDTRLGIRKEVGDKDGCVLTESVTEEEDNNYYFVNIPSVVTIAEFNLIAKRDAEPIRVPLGLCIPRLRWSLRFDDSDIKEIEWTPTLLKQSLPKVEQSNRSILLVSADLPRGHRLKITLSLVLTESEKELQIISNKEISKNEPRCSFDLKQFLDTIRYYQEEPFFDIMATVESPQIGAPLSFPIVRITRALNIQDVMLKRTENRNWKLHWCEPNPLRNRRVHIWSLWRPWNKPIEIALPDNPATSDSVTDGDWYMHELHFNKDELIDGAYVTQFRAIPSWEPKTISEYPPKENYHMLSTIDPHERLDLLGDQLEKDSKRAFKFHFEYACILDHIGQIEKRDKEIAWCSSNFRRASIPLLLIFYDWLSNRDSFTQKALRLRMYNPTLLDKLFTHYPKKEIREKYLEPIAQVENIAQESARMILEYVNTPALISKAINILVQENDPIAVEYIVESINSGNFSDLGAFEILKTHADFALFALLGLPNSPSRQRLLKNLSEYTEKPLLIYPGWWIYCDAGWGKIIRIQDQATGEELPKFLVNEMKPILDIILRPKHEKIIAQVDISKEKIFFPDDDKLFCCINSGCRRFISNQRYYVKSRHNHFAHNGCGASIRPIKKGFYQIRTSPEYFPNPPENTLL